MLGGRRGQRVLCWCCNASGNSSWSCSRHPANERSLKERKRVFAKKMLLTKLLDFKLKDAPYLCSAGVVASIGHAASSLLQVVPHHQRNLPHPRVGPGRSQFSSAYDSFTCWDKGGSCSHGPAGSPWCRGKRAVCSRRSASMSRTWSWPRTTSRTLGFLVFILVIKVARIKLRKKWLPPMARKGALMPRTSSSLIPAKPERHPSYHLSSSRSENINFQTLSSIPESISLWPAISFIHFFLLN